MAKIVLVARGTGGDLVPFLFIGKMLKDRGHCVVLLTHYYLAERVERAGLDFAAIDSPESYLNPFEASSERKLEMDPKSSGRHILSRVVRECEIIYEHCNESNTLLISHHSAQLTTQTAADKLGAPLALIFPAPYFVMELQMVEYMYAIHAEYINQMRAEMGLSKVSDWRAWIGSGASYIGLWPEWFATSEPYWPGPLHMVGFINDNRFEKSVVTEEVKEILDSSDRLVLITHATTKPDKESYFAVCAEACRLLGYRGIIITWHEQLIADCLSEKVKWFKYLPHACLLPHMHAVIHHGGIGTCGQVLSAGIPQLVLPYGYDRPDNAGRLKRLGVADFLPSIEWEPNLIARSLHALMNDPAVRNRCHEMARYIDCADPVIHACEIVERLTMDGRSN